MTTLMDQQRALAAAIARAEPVPGLLREAPGGRPARLQVYQEAYRARLEQALDSNFPIVHRVLGDEAFHDLAREYLLGNPSHWPSIRWFGHRLPAFLRTHGDRHPALADLAAMEWALRAAFDAADAVPLVVDELVGVAPASWPELRFASHPSVALLTLAWAIEPLWKALSADPNADADTPVEHAHRLLIWRQGLETSWRALDTDEAELLQACFAGRAFAELGALAEQQRAEAAATRLAGLLRQWVEAGLLMLRG